MSNPILSCHKLSKTFLDGQLIANVLQQVSLDVFQGEMIAIIGASGTGKSTLLHCLGGLENPSSGEVLIAGKNIFNLNESQRSLWRNENLGFIYQFHHLLPEFTALENVAMPLMIRGIKKKIAKQKAYELLVKVGMEDKKIYKPAELSGGQRQRIAIARALITLPKCVLADEPTGNLDRVLANDVFQLMLYLNHEYNISFIIVTHDNEIASKCNTIYYMEDGRLARCQ